MSDGLTSLIRLDEWWYGVTNSETCCGFIDLSIHRGYIFVQYDNLQSSNAAIAKLDKTPYKGGVLRECPNYSTHHIYMSLCVRIAGFHVSYQLLHFSCCIAYCLERTDSSTSSCNIDGHVIGPVLDQSERFVMSCPVMYGFSLYVCLSSAVVKLAEKGRKHEAAEREYCRFYMSGNCLRGKMCNFIVSLLLPLDHTTSHRWALRGTEGHRSCQLSELTALSPSYSTVTLPNTPPRRDPVVGMELTTAQEIDPRPSGDHLARRETT